MQGDYRAVVNFDYTGTHSPSYQRILKALDAAGWAYVETSAMAYEGDLSGVLLALEVLAKSPHTGGTVSALTLHVQLIGEARSAPGYGNPDEALETILAMDLPSDSN